MNNKMIDTLQNKRPIEYSAYDLNILISLLLTDICGAELMTEEQGEKCKSVFNELMDLVVNHPDIADDLIVEGEKMTQEYEQDLEEEEVWNIITAAEKVRDDTLMN